MDGWIDTYNIIESYYTAMREQ